MREIKFRAWDNENEYMITSKQGIFTAIQYSMNITRQDNGYYTNGDLLKPNKERYTLMQYTGLKDKNGKEIYEGDIVKIIYRKGFKEGEPIYIEFIAKVTYYSKYASFIIENCKPSSIIHECENLGDYENIEVIGNIYENSDLLDREDIKE